MTCDQFRIFSDFREDFRSYCSHLNQSFASLLSPLQKEAAKKDTPDYPIETPVVYNTALDEITQDSEIRLIVIGDNPGKEEQRAFNQKYLVGQSGKIAAGFFARHPEFKTDFRKNAIILNKTPIHSAKTNHLKAIKKGGGEKIAKLLSDSQLYMAQKTASLHSELCLAAGDNGIKPQIWLVGYAELKGRGLFLEYRDALKAKLTDNPDFQKEDSPWNRLFVFQHFSMNRFSIDLKNFMEKNPEMDILQACRELGKLHRTEIF